ncbi:DgyrCDS8524 [Dimorphilus gyrociliatus]|uniref:DgyrCDS8524 n=1 Tax=Dimorphilus gyrociliatus TaxID=2664684 RepID=A0A7I8VWQ5_9ANNE|nr:DgyrCDS8524 [Dimorphilus gyrociliatus]
MTFKLVFLLLLFKFAFSERTSCRPCSEVECQKLPRTCLAGLVKDKCGCCDVCGQLEFEPCYHPEVDKEHDIWKGRCGKGLTCRIRKDLPEEDPSIAVCRCDMEEDYCGDDGISYTSICSLLEKGKRTNKTITIARTGPCDSDDDPKLSVNTRGGPEKWQKTGWVQIQRIEEKHEGDYICIAINNKGKMTKAEARLNVAIN